MFSLCALTWVKGVVHRILAVYSQIDSIECIPREVVGNLDFQQNGSFQRHMRKLVTILKYPQTAARAASCQPGVLVKFLTVKILGRSSLQAGFILPHC